MLINAIIKNILPTLPIIQTRDIFSPTRLIKPELRASKPEMKTFPVEITVALMSAYATSWILFSKIIFHISKITFTVIRLNSTINILWMNRLKNSVKPSSNKIINNIFSDTF